MVCMVKTVVVQPPTSATTGANGMGALGGYCKMVVDQDYNVIVVKNAAGDDVSMSNDYPAVTDVKDGVIYNRTTLEGTLVAGGRPVRIVPLLGVLGK